MNSGETFRAREIVLFTLGALTFLHEAFFTSAERPFLLAASLAMMGFPILVRGDAWIRRNGGGKNGQA